MTQMTFDLDALDDTRVREMYSCGVHELRRQPVEHWEECRKNKCPRCGEVSGNGWLAELNHGSAESRWLCEKQITLLNHAHRCRIILDGEWIHPPQSNCYAKAHDHRKYIEKGVPLECVQAELDEIQAWLITSGVPENYVGLPASRAGALRPQSHSIHEEESK